MTHSVAHPVSDFPAAVPGFESSSSRTHRLEESMAHRVLIVVGDEAGNALDAAVMNSWFPAGTLAPVVKYIDGMYPAGASAESPARWVATMRIRSGEKIARNGSVSLLPVLTSAAGGGPWERVRASSSNGFRVVPVSEIEMVRFLSPSDEKKIPAELHVEVPAPVALTSRELVEEFFEAARAFYSSRRNSVEADLLYVDYVGHLKGKLGEDASPLSEKTFSEIAASILGLVRTRQTERGPVQFYDLNDGAKTWAETLASAKAARAAEDAEDAVEAPAPSAPPSLEYIRRAIAAVDAAEAASAVVDPQTLLRTPALKRSLIEDYARARLTAIDGLTRVDTVRDFVFSGFEEDDAVELVELSDRVEVAEFVSDVVGEAFDPAATVAAPEVYEVFCTWSLRHRGARPMPKAEFEAALTWVLNV